MILCTFGWCIRWVLQNLSGSLRTSLDSLPIFSLYRDFIAAQFMETTGLLLTNGIVLKRALVLLKPKASIYLQSHLVMMEFRLSSGFDNIADVLDTGLISPADLQRLKVIAKGKGFTAALSRLGQRANQRAVNTAQILFRFLGGIFFALSGTVAVLVILGIYSVGRSLAG
jgi:type II secretory pathway component PulF